MSKSVYMYRQTVLISDASIQFLPSKLDAVVTALATLFEVSLSCSSEREKSEWGGRRSGHTLDLLSGDQDSGHIFDQESRSICF